MRRLKRVWVKLKDWADIALFIYQLLFDRTYFVDVLGEPICPDQKCESFWE